MDVSRWDSIDDGPVESEKNYDDGRVALLVVIGHAARNSSPAAVVILTLKSTHDKMR